jgi:anthrone oxygenase-like protein
MQASLAVLGFLAGVSAWWLAGVSAWWQTSNWVWLLGALILIANWPYTLLGIMPTNQKLMATDPAGAAPETRDLIEKWGGLHAVRTGLGFAATAIFLWASMS